MSFPQKVKSALWAIVDNMACNTAQFVKNPQKDFTRGRKLGFVQLIHFFLCMGAAVSTMNSSNIFISFPKMSHLPLPSSSSGPSSFRKLSAISLPSSTSASLLAGFGESIPSLPQTAVNSTLPATPTTLPPSIPPAAGQKRASTHSTQSLYMTCFPSGTWMQSSSPAGSKTNLPPSASS